MDLAVGVILGAAFGKIVTSLVNDILNPIIGLAVGGIDFSSWFFSLNGQHYANLAEAKAAKAPTINVGIFINTVIEFLIVAFVIFLIVKQVNRLLAKPEEAPAPSPARKDCPHCCTSIPLGATRCPACTSTL